jgi:type IV pilus assembly protein PilA
MKKLNNQEGFTLVELMVVVAIIGILSAIAIPNFQTYQAKSKSSEARLQLSSIYTSEVSFAADYDNYAACLEDMGYTPGGNAANDYNGPNRYYAIGFAAGEAALDDINGSNCSSTGGEEQSVFGTNLKSSGGASAVSAWLDAGSIVPATGDSFLAEAVGIVSSDFNTSALADRWTIDELKTIEHTVQGY